MTVVDQLDALARRIAALETEHFEFDQQLRRITDATDRNAAGLDALEESLDEINSLAPDTEALAAAMAQRQVHLDGDLSSAPHVLVAEPVLGAGLAVPSVHELPTVTPPTSTAPSPSEEPGASPPPELATLHAWVEEHIAPLVRKTTTTGEGGGVRWCRRWWEHVDALTRVQALYLAFDELSHDESATWLSVYLRDHLDPHMATLTSPYGPFYACNPTKHSDAIQELGQQPLTESDPAAVARLPVLTGGQP
jgi:hypothetical protein